MHLYTIIQDRKEQLVHTCTVGPRHQRSVSIHTLRQSHGQEAGSILHSCITTVALDSGHSKLAGKCTISVRLVHLIQDRKEQLVHTCTVRPDIKEVFGQ